MNRQSEAKNEANAIKEYEKKQASLHNNLNTELCGLRVNPEFIFIGASLDAIASRTKCHSGGVGSKMPFHIM